MALPEEMPDDPLASEDEGPVDAFETEIRSAFPNEDWTPDRVMALKEAIKICVEADENNEYDKPPPKKGGSGLALIFGAPKKGK